MPIFQEDLEQGTSAVELEMASPPGFRHPNQSHVNNKPSARRLSDDSIRTELCEGPIFDNPENQDDEPFTTCSDRAELIERLKRGESPTWIPNRLATSLSFRSNDVQLIGDQVEPAWTQRSVTPSRNSRPTANSPNLLSPSTISPEKRDLETEDEKRLREGLNIERPRSALHSGDFTHDEFSNERGTTDARSSYDRVNSYGMHGRQAWISTSPPRDFAPFQQERRQPVLGGSADPHSGFLSLSSSLSSAAFLYKPPTSPLVQSESHEDLDLTTPMDGIDISSGYYRNSRRHTLMSSCSGSPGFSTPNPPSLRHERTYPYQAHQPRRSLNLTSSFSFTGISPQTPASLRSRRPSYSSDSSPIQHASMVGSYEESILRGRMSTTPSKPLDFVAQIGVLGLGNCKSNLRCPPHVTLPFPAVFYSYASSSYGRSKTDDGPSPYVGQVDLENGLSNQGEEARSKRKTQNRGPERKPTAEYFQEDGSEATTERITRDARRSHKQKRRSGSPRAPPGGSYRIPEKGQIQIIIKNPNKTAVKLFLVPYDLVGMEPATKTFVRQRSYSAGPIIDNLPELKDTSGADRPTLRYLVHLHICCPSRGRFYLYKSIRVVFANRVPDGKEKLQNEMTLPEPRFTAYKPIRVMHPPIAAGTGPGASLAAEKAFRRRSSGFYIGTSGRTFDAADGIISDSTTPQQQSSFSFTPDNKPVGAIPFLLPQRQPPNNTSASYGASRTDVWSPGSSQMSRPTTQDSSNVSSLGDYNSQLDRYDKLNKGDVGYGGNAFSNLINGRPGTAEGLLSQRLRTLGVEAEVSQGSNDMEQ